MRTEVFSSPSFFFANEYWLAAAFTGPAPTTFLGLTADYVPAPNSKSEARISKQYQMFDEENSKQRLLIISAIGHSSLFRISIFGFRNCNFYPCHPRKLSGLFAP